MDDSIRRDSVVLRRFLIYRDLIRVWVTVMGKGRSLMVPASNITVLDGRGLGQMDFASSSEVHQPGIKVGAVSVTIGPLEEKYPIRMEKRRPIRLKKFIFGYSCIVQGVPIRRNDIVQFVANKLGGAHYDTGRQKPDAQALSRLDKYEVAERNAVYYEMLAVGQELGRSESCVGLLEKLDEYVG